MTITIHRPIWLQRPAIWLGLAAILAAVTVAVFQNTGTDPAEVGASNVSVATATASAAARKAFLEVQDDYLPPTATPESAARRAFLDMQDDYLPPTATPESAARKAFLDMQDDYLPPTATPAPAELEANDLSDNRTNGPR